mgnify:CR=1 FL=1
MPRLKLQGFAPFMFVPLMVCPVYNSSADKNLDNFKVRQRADYTSDYRSSDLYHLDQPVEIIVHVKEFLFPDTGYVQLLFTLPPGYKMNFLKDREHKKVFRADLQLVDALREARMSKADIPKGKKVRLVGWPKTRANKTDSVMLVSELAFFGTGRTTIFNASSQGVTYRN